MFLSLCEPHWSKCLDVFLPWKYLLCANYYFVLLQISFCYLQFYMYKFCLCIHISTVCIYVLGKVNTVVHTKEIMKHFHLVCTSYIFISLLLTHFYTLCLPLTPTPPHILECSQFTRNTNVLYKYKCVFIQHCCS